METVVVVAAAAIAAMAMGLGVDGALHREKTELLVLHGAGKLNRLVITIVSSYRN